MIKKVITLFSIILLSVLTILIIEVYRTYTTTFDWGSLPDWFIVAFTFLGLVVSGIGIFYVVKTLEAQSVSNDLNVFMELFKDLKDEIKNFEFNESDFAYTDRIIYFRANRIITITTAHHPQIKSLGLEAFDQLTSIYLTYPILRENYSDDMRRYRYLIVSVESLQTFILKSNLSESDKRLLNDKVIILIMATMNDTLNQIRNYVVDRRQEGTIEDDVNLTQIITSYRECLRINSIIV